MKSRPTGFDYRKELQQIKQSERSLDSHVTARVLELSNIHPDAIVTKIGDTEIKAIGITRQWVEGLDINERIGIIETIEKWSAEKQNIKQLEI